MRSKREREKERGCQRGRERGSKIERMEFKKPGGGGELVCGKIKAGECDRAREENLIE